MRKNRALTKREEHWKSIPIDKKIKFYLQLAFIGGITIAEQEELGIVDMLPSPDNIIMDGSLSGLETFRLVHDEYEDKIELRDESGFKVMSFDIDPNADLSIFPNLVTKDEYAVTHNLLAAEPKIIGKTLYKLVRDEKEDKIISLNEVKEDAEHAFAYTIKSQEQMVSLVNALCGDKFELLHTKANDSSEAKLYDVENGKYITGDLKSILAETFEQIGMPQEYVDAILNGDEKELEETTEEEYYISNEAKAEDIEVLDTSVLETMTKQTDGSFVVEDQKEFKKTANISNILTFLKYKIDVYKDLSPMLQQEDIVELIKEGIKAEGGSREQEMAKSLSKLYSFIIMRETGSGKKILHRVNQEINAKVQAYVEEHNITEYKGRKVSKLSNSELLEMLDENYKQAMKESEKEMIKQDEGQAKFDKQQAFYNSQKKISSKEQLNLQDYYEDQVAKHETRMEELLDDAVRTEDLRKELQIKVLYQEFADAITKEQRRERIAQENRAVLEGTLNSNLSLADLINADRSKIEALDAIEDEQIQEEEQEAEDEDIKIYIPEREKEQEVKISASAFFEADTDNLDKLTNDVPEIGEQINYKEEQEQEEENTIEGIDQSDFYEM